jgi:hypothetical protein
MKTLLMVSFALVVGAASLFAQSRGGVLAEPAAQVRSCAGASEDPTCAEIHAAAPELRDWLRAHVREEKWHIEREEDSADTWTFVRNLERDELAQAARTDMLGGRIAWTSGKATVTAKTSEAGNGYTRVQISARFVGRGHAPQNFARPSDLWPLASRKTLEGGMMAALKSHFQAEN